MRLPDPALLTESARLHAACRSHDLQTRAAAYETLWRYLYRAALHIAHDQPDAEALSQDCAQTALIRIHARLAECREPAAFHAWARRIAGRVVIDELRRRKRLIALVEEDDALTPEPADPSPAVETASLDAIHLNVKVLLRFR